LLVASINTRRPIVIALFVAFGPLVSGKADQIDDYIAAQHIPGVSPAIPR
jgi:hypothetical protein